MYGNVAKEKLPIDEEFIIHPASPYAISKNLWHTGLETTAKRTIYLSQAVFWFNHESVLRRQNFVTKKIISSALKIKRNELDSLKVGNTSIQRDWGYAPEYMERCGRCLMYPNLTITLSVQVKHNFVGKSIDKVFIKLEIGSI